MTVVEFPPEMILNKTLKHLQHRSRSAQQPTGDSATRTIDRSEAQALTLMLRGIPQKRTSDCTFEKLPERHRCGGAVEAEAEDLVMESTVGCFERCCLL